MKNDCDDLEPLIEAIADASYELSPEAAAHVETCALCSHRIEQARSIEQLLSLREIAQPSPVNLMSVIVSPSTCTLSEILSPQSGLVPATSFAPGISPQLRGDRNAR